MVGRFTIRYSSFIIHHSLPHFLRIVLPAVSLGKLRRRECVLAFARLDDIDRLCRDGLGIIVTSSELLTLCNRILVLCEGHMTGQLGREEATEQRIMELATQRPGVEV